MLRLTLVPIIVALLLGTAAPGLAMERQRCFEQSGLCIDGVILAAWERGGGMAVFGAPLTNLTFDTIEGRRYQIQWFEGARFEIHPTLAPPYNVQIGRIGDEMLLAQGQNWRTMPASGAQSDCRYFPETKQNVCGDFLAAWRAAGANDAARLMALGYPLTSARQEANGVTSQWFERARLDRTSAGATRAKNLAVELRGSLTWKIANAMSAAPVSVSGNATIVDWPGSDGVMPVLRQGDSRWTCLPDDVTNPHNDPMCNDEMWMIWLKAIIAGEVPAITRPGISYMLQDDAAGSTSDPSVLSPPHGEHWKSDGPHMMFIFPAGTDLSALPTAPGSGGPRVMWAGSPYQHVMMPIAATLPTASSDRVANARSAGPPSLMRDAPVVDWPAGTGPVSLPVGANGWTCLADDPWTPTTNDPFCIDGSWRAWLEALYAGNAPALTRPGFGYHLQGAAFASASDPAAAAPTDPAGWMIEPPSVVLVVPQRLDPAHYPLDHGRGPWLMWANTPYQHIMIPVR